MKAKYEIGQLILDADPWIVAPEVPTEDMQDDPIGIIIDVYPDYVYGTHSYVYKIHWRSHNKTSEVLEHVLDSYCIVVDAVPVEVE
jgi:hypothetical protein